MRKKEKLPLWERSEYDVVSETETENGLVAELKIRHSGATVICNIPRHTDDEENDLAGNITKAMMQIIFSGQDISELKHMEIISK